MGSYRTWESILMIEHIESRTLLSYVAVVILALNTSVDMPPAGNQILHLQSYYLHFQLICIGLTRLIGVLSRSAAAAGTSPEYACCQNEKAGANG